MSRRSIEAKFSLGLPRLGPFPAVSNSIEGFTQLLHFILKAAVGISGMGLPKRISFFVIESENSSLSLDIDMARLPVHQRLAPRAHLTFSLLAIRP